MATKKKAKKTAKKTAGTAKKVESKELAPTDPEFLPVQYSMTDAKLAELAKDYDPALIPKAEEKGDDGYQIIHDKTMAITKVRTSVEAKRKELKADAIEWGKKVDGEAKRITAAIAALEEPWRKIKVALDEKEAREAEEARQREIDDMAEIERKIADIKRLTSDLVGASAETLRLRIEHVNSIVIDEDGFGLFMDGAKLAKLTVLDDLTKAYNERKEFEAAQEKLREDQEKIAAAQKKIDDQQADIDRQKAEQEAREQAERDEKEKAEREAREEADRLQREAEARQAAEKKLADEAEAKRLREEELEKRKPEDQKVREYGLALVSVPVPEVTDPDLVKLLAGTHEDVIEINQFIIASTQGE